MQLYQIIMKFIEDTVHSFEAHCLCLDWGNWRGFHQTGVSKIRGGEVLLKVVPVLLCLDCFLDDLEQGEIDQARVNKNFYFLLLDVADC